MQIKSVIIVSLIIFFLIQFSIMIGAENPAFNTITKQPKHTILSSKQCLCCCPCATVAGGCNYGYHAVKDCKKSLCDPEDEENTSFCKDFFSCPDQEMIKKSREDVEEILNFYFCIDDPEATHKRIITFCTYPHVCCTQLCGMAVLTGLVLLFVPLSTVLCGLECIKGSGKSIENWYNYVTKNKDTFEFPNYVK